MTAQLSITEIQNFLPVPAAKPAPTAIYWVVKAVIGGRLYRATVRALSADTATELALSEFPAGALSAFAAYVDRNQTAW